MHAASVLPDAAGTPGTVFMASFYRRSRVLTSSAWSGKYKRVSFFVALALGLVVVTSLLHGGLLSRTPLANGCHHVYIDLGTNLGVQIRKLYEPHLFPGALALANFDRYFGPGNRSDVCAFGFESNPRHASVLTTLVERYVSLGRTVDVYAAAAGCDNGFVEFVPDLEPDARDNAEWGASVKALSTVMSPASGAVVRMVGLPDWLEQHVLQRRLPRPDSSQPLSRPPTLLLKLDIEGADVGVLRCLLQSGALCAFAYVSFEARHVPAAVAAELQADLLQRGCVTRLQDLDDESYHTFGWVPDAP